MTESDTLAQSIRLIKALRDRNRYAHSVTSVEILETHISWVLLTGSIVYKIKKPLDLGFLDFRLLDARRHYCEEELRLNRRLAPSLYQATIKITGTADDPRIGGDGPAIEYAVQMRQFSQDAMASNLLKQGKITASDIESLARLVATFHINAGIAARGGPYGTTESIIRPARENFTQLETLWPAGEDRTQLATLRAWSEREYQDRWADWVARQDNGCVRECHGDLHLGNITMIDHELLPFDCLEFDPALRLIDVMSEVAFLVMDLMDRDRPDLSARFLNAYLASSGDFEGVKVLRFYLVYRAMVRAKVHALRAQQDGLALDARARLTGAVRDYVALAQQCATDQRPAFVLMHGLSGSGKSVIAQAIADSMVALHVRSDVERKRLYGLQPLARSGSAPDTGLYAEDRTRSTYERLLDLARLGTQAGYPVIVDATFLKYWQRERFRREAARQGIPFLIIDVTAPEPILRARIEARQLAGRDASEADSGTLALQFAGQDELRAEETSQTLTIDSVHMSLPEILGRLQKALPAQFQHLN